MREKLARVAVPIAVAILLASARGESAPPEAPRATIVSGSIRTADPIRFGADSADLLPESHTALAAVRRLLLDHPEIRLLDIEGHTDGRGAADHNLDLSSRRAAAVKDWLAAQGVDSGRLTSHGFGPSRPIATNDTEEGRRRNRRVEFHVVEASPERTAAAAVVSARPERPTPKTGPDVAKVAIGATGSALGVVDTNIFDKGANTVQAVGFDVTAGLTVGVPVTPTLSWASAIGLGTNYRDGVGGDVGGADAMRVDASVKTGIEALLAGRTSLAGRKVKRSTFPSVKLSLDAKYALWANPLITQPPALDDETVDALEPSDDDEAGGSSGGGGGGGDASRERSASPRRYAQASSNTASDAAPDAGDGGGEGEGEEEQPAEVQAGPQTFSNPNFHNKVSGIARLDVETSKRLSFAADATFGRDFVDLEDSVETSPNYDEITAGLSAKDKLSPKLLWLTLGYVFERRFYDDLSAAGASQDFFVQGAKVAVDLPWKPGKLKVSYDLRFKLADADGKNTTRNQVQASGELPLDKIFSAIAEARFTYTIFDGAPDSTRLIVLAGMKAKL
jgi:outer membrane protein OmpA-like peptidoglycan-associated protein